MNKLLIFYSIVILILILLIIFLVTSKKHKETFTDDIVIPVVESKEVKKPEDYYKSPLDFIRTNKYNLVANHDNKIFFWEPQSIEDYFPLGHITTNTPEQPKKSSLLLKSNTKPSDYMPVGMCSNTHLIWRPIPHSIGYIVSKEKPSINKIRIIEPSKLSKTTISDMFYDSGQIGSSKGISLWNIENSDYFFAKSKDKNNDKIHDLYSIPKQLSNPQKRLKLTFTDKYDKIWENKTEQSMVSVWRPKTIVDYVSLGDFITNKNMNPNGIHKMPLVHKDNAAQIIDWDPKKVQVKKNDVDIYFWKPISRSGYATLGNVIAIGNKEPSSNNIFSIPLANLKEIKENSVYNIWNTIPDENNMCNIWSSNSGFFHAQSNWQKPNTTLYDIDFDTVHSQKDITDSIQEALIKYIPRNIVFNMNEKIIETLSSKLDIDKNRIIIKGNEKNAVIIQIEKRNKNSLEKNSEEIIIELSDMIAKNINVKHNNQIIVILNDIEILSKNSDVIDIK